jgi:5'-phosphate synthase pdxT subunit
MLHLSSSANLLVKIGVLALQGAFIEHVAKLKSIPGVEPIEVRTRDQLQGLDGLIIPGGESTSMVLIAERSNMLDPLREFVHRPDKAVWGTCAGLILLSNKLEGQKEGGQAVLGGLDVTTSRNYFGRQLNSFECNLWLKKEAFFEEAESKPFRGIFIRAPAIVSVDGPDVEVLAEVDVDPRSSSRNKTVLESGEEKPGSEAKVVVAVQQGRLLGTAFHPELTDDLRWHQKFVELTRKTKQQSLITCA